MSLEREAMSDISMLPDTPGALVRQWRSFDRDGSALGALINVGWMAVAACLAVLAEKAAVWGLSRRVRRRMRLRPEGPTLPGLLALLLCDAIGAFVFASVFFYSRHWLTGCRGHRQPAASGILRPYSVASRLRRRAGPAAAARSGGAADRAAR